MATNSPPIGGVVDALIAQSGSNVVPLGGFGGRRGPITAHQLADWVNDEQLRYFLLIGGLEDALVSDVSRLCQAVPDSEWGGSAEPTPAGHPDTLYDCGGKGSELLAAASAA